MKGIISELYEVSMILQKLEEKIENMELDCDAEIYEKISECLNILEGN